MKNKNVFLAIPIVCLLSFTVVKTISLNEAFKNLEFYNSYAYPDKVYLHTDRVVYASEDTIWIKSYLVNGITHKSETASNVIHIELVNEENQVVHSQIGYINDIGSANDIIINRAWKPGKYLLRGYTKFMLNEDPEYLFTKELQILDINEEYDKYTAEFGTKEITLQREKNISYNLSFYPEGGDLIEGLENRIGLKLDGVTSEDPKIKGAIVDEEDNQVAEFKIYQFGLGSVSFVPEKGKKYYASLDIKGNGQKFAIPASIKSGITINTTTKFESIGLILKSTQADGLQGGKLIGHTRGKIFIEKDIPSDLENEYSIKIQTNDLLSGIASFTFFNKDGMPECERLVFVDNENVEFKIETEKAIYNKREKLNFKISEGSDQIDENPVYDCSVSIVELANLNITDSHKNIKTWLLLNSDLKGKIESPEYFFEKSKDYKRSYLLDLVMLTNGWRRFTWKELSEPNVFSDLENEREGGLFIEGQTSRMINADKGVKTNLTLTFMNNAIHEEEIVTDDDGKFRFGPYTAFDTVDAFIQARRYKENKSLEKLEGKRNVNIHLFDDKLFVDDVWKPSTNESINNSQSFNSYLTNSKTAQVLKDQYSLMSVELDELVIRAKSKKIAKRIDEKQKSMTYYSNPSNRLTFENGENLRYITIYDMLRNVAGVSVNGSAGQQSVTIRGVGSINGSSEPLYLLDGIQVTPDIVSFISPAEVDFIDVLKGPNAAIFGLRGGNGVISIFTGNTHTSIKERKPGIVNFTLNGFNPGREFYSPDYSKDVSRVFTPDTRSTLYWNPLVTINAGESKELSLHTGDITGNFEILIEGIGSDGKLVHQKHQFEVR